MSKISAVAAATLLYLTTSILADDLPLPAIDSDPVIEDAIAIGAPACQCDNCQALPACRPTTLFWGSAEYLQWWRSESSHPPLISTGILGSGGTVLFGGNLGGEAESGFRGTLGLWLDPQHATGIMARYFTLGDESESFDSTGLAEVARPFIDLTPGSPVFGQENAVIVNDVAAQTVGVVNAAWESHVWGLDVLYRLPIRCNATDRLDFLAGYQTSRVDEALRTQQTISEGGVTIRGAERFEATNEFQGGALGLQFERRVCRWSCHSIAKIGIGNMTQSVSINGAETRDPPPTSSEGFLLALPTNIGSYSRDEFTFIPEVGVSLGYQIDYRFTFTVGYSFIYWDSIVQVGDQLDRSVNGTQVSGGVLSGDARPAFAFKDGGYWVQGWNLGLSAEF